MTTTLRIAGVADVSIGYGSPQIPAFMASLSRHYGESVVDLFEPDQPEKPPRHDAFPAIRFHRVRTKIHPHGHLGRLEYITRLTPLVEALNPDVLVIFCSYSLPVLFKLRRRPRLVIYYAYEQPSAYGSFDVAMNSQIGDLVDLIIYPEENRAALDMQTCGYRGIPTAILYNCTNPSQTEHFLPLASRNGRMVYQGTIEQGRTFAEYYDNPQLGPMPIDLFGPISGADREKIKLRLAAGTNGIRYLGLVDSTILARVRPSYMFSIISWRPNTENQLYACPNKFFEAIADGVPPIAAPHPQTRALLEKYKCGIVMEDWSFDSFRASLQRALRMAGSPEYNRLAENCRVAVNDELNWDVQFAKVKQYLR